MKKLLIFFTGLIFILLILEIGLRAFGYVYSLKNKKDSIIENEIDV